LEGSPSWQEISGKAAQLSAATSSMREKLIKNDFESGFLKPVKDQCKKICLDLNKKLELLGNADDSIMKATATNAMEATMDLEGLLDLLIDIADTLNNDPSVADRLELKRNWPNAKKEAISVSRSTAALLDALVKIIKKAGKESEGNARADTG
jgi:hypothetical protein